MTASHRTFTAAFLRRAGLLLGLLAIIAGLFGMHVMTGNHSRHAPAAVTAPTPGVHAGSAATDGRAVHQGSGTSPVRPAADLRDAAGTPAQMCPCSESCTGLHAMTGSCTLSVKTGSLSAPSPGTTVVGAIPRAGLDGTGPGSYGHLPDSPSPGELSISRT